MLAPLRQRLVLLLVLAAGGSYLLARHGRSVGITEGALGPACERLFSVLTPCFVVLAVLVVIGRAIANRRKLGNGFSRAQVAVTNGIAAALLGILGFELFARWKDPLPKREEAHADNLSGVRQPDARLGWSGRPLFDQPTIYHIDDKQHPGEKVDLAVRVRTNSLGFRDIEQVRDPAKPAVVVVGDSYAWGHCVELEDSAVYKLRPKLPEAQVFNLSCAAYSLDQIVLSYEIHGRPLKPKVVVAFFLYVPGNMKSSPIGWGLQKPWFRFVDGKLELQAEHIEFGKDDAERRLLVERAEASGVYDFGSALRYLFHDWGQSESWFLRRASDAYDQMQDRSEGVPRPPRLVLAILQRLAQKVKEDGATLLVATGPELTIVSWDRIVRAEHQKKLAAYGAALPYVGPFQPAVQALRDSGLDVLDLTPCFQPEGEALYDRDLHPGIEGNERMVEPLRARIAPLLAR